MSGTHYLIGADGLQADDGKIDIHPEGVYWYGGSDSPDQVLVSRIEGNRVYFEECPLRDAEPAERSEHINTFSLLAKSGCRSRMRRTEAFLRAVERRTFYSPEQAQERRESGQAEIEDLQRTLQGSNPANRHTREDQACFEVFVQGNPGEDLWGAIDRATGGCCNGCHEDHASGKTIYECSVFGLNHFAQIDQQFSVTSAQWGESEVLDRLRDLLKQREAQPAPGM